MLIVSGGGPSSAICSSGDILVNKQTPMDTTRNVDSGHDALHEDGMLKIVRSYVTSVCGNNLCDWQHTSLPH